MSFLILKITNSVLRKKKPRKDNGTIAYFQYQLPHQELENISVLDLPDESSPCDNFQTLNEWRTFQAEVKPFSFTEAEDDPTLPEPTRERRVTAQTNRKLPTEEAGEGVSKHNERMISANQAHPTTKSLLWGFLHSQKQLYCIVTGASLPAALEVSHVLEQKYCERDLVVVYTIIGGFVYIHSKINILPMTRTMHRLWDRGLIVIYIREKEVLHTLHKYLLGFLSFRRLPLRYDWLSILRRCDKYMYDGRVLKIGFGAKFEPQETGFTSFKHHGQTRAHPILLLVRLAFLMEQPAFEPTEFVYPPEDEELFKEALRLAEVIRGLLKQEYERRYGPGVGMPGGGDIKKGRGDDDKKGGGGKGGRKGGRRTKKGGRGEEKDGGEDQARKKGDEEQEDASMNSPYEGMVIHCPPMMDVSSTFTNDVLGNCEGVCVWDPESTWALWVDGKSEAQYIAKMWRKQETSPSPSISLSHHSPSLCCHFRFSCLGKRKPIFFGLPPLPKLKLQYFWCMLPAQAT